MFSFTRLRVIFLDSRRYEDYFEISRLMNLAFNPRAELTPEYNQQLRRPNVIANGDNGTLEQQPEQLPSPRRILLAELHRMEPAIGMNDNNDKYIISIHQAVISPRGLIIVRDAQDEPHILRFLLCVWDLSTSQPLCIDYTTDDERRRFFEFQRLADIPDNMEEIEELLKNVSKVRDPLDVTIVRAYGRLPTGHVYPYWTSDLTLRKLVAI